VWAKKMAAVLTGRSVPQRAPTSGSTRFQKGHAKKGGRTKGVPNKMSREFAEDVLAVAAEQGADGQGSRGLLGYLVRLATDAPKVFVGLLHAELGSEEKAQRRGHGKPCKSGGYG
jgi:hypothetical protein